MPEETLITQMKLAVVRQIHDLTDSTPDDKLEDIRTALGSIYNALDVQGIDTAPLLEAYNQVELLHQQAGHGVDIAAAARAAAHELAEKLELTAGTLQRVRDEKATLEQAVIEGDTGHPLIEDAWQKLQDETEMAFLESAWVSYCPACDIINAHDDLTHNTAQIFHEFLYDGSDLSPTEQAELENFIISFVRRVSDRHENERKQVKETPQDV